MIPRDIVQQAIHFERPARLAIHLQFCDCFVHIHDRRDIALKSNLV